MSIKTHPHRRTQKYGENGRRVGKRVQEKSAGYLFVRFEHNNDLWLWTDLLSHNVNSSCVECVVEGMRHICAKHVANIFGDTFVNVRKIFMTFEEVKEEIFYNWQFLLGPGFGFRNIQDSLSHLFAALSVCCFKLLQSDMDTGAHYSGFSSVRYMSVLEWPKGERAVWVYGSGKV